MLAVNFVWIAHDPVCRPCATSTSLGANAYCNRLTVSRRFPRLVVALRATPRTSTSGEMMQHRRCDPLPLLGRAGHARRPVERCDQFPVSCSSRIVTLEAISHPATRCVVECSALGCRQRRAVAFHDLLGFLGLRRDGASDGILGSSGNFITWESLDAQTSYFADPDRHPWEVAYNPAKAGEADAARRRHRRVPRRRKPE